MSRIDALLRERAGYVVRNLPDRVAQVDAELARLGHEAPVEFAAVSPDAADAAVIKRGPGRPRKL